MPTIFEAFGFRLDDGSAEAVQARNNASCVFMATQCDGGGNRFSTQISLNSPEHQELVQLYPNRTQLMPGVCSIQSDPQSPPWIVCPRRLLALAGAQGSPYQAATEQNMIAKLAYPAGTRLGVWREVSVNTSQVVDGQKKSFEYNFDYVIYPVGRSRLADVAAYVGLPVRKVKNALEDHYTIALRDGEDWVEDFAALPTDTYHPYPGIIELMTSSTSGGNKKTRTTIPQAFEDAMLGKPHQAPGINKRQVWARMVSQLVVKSEVGNAWGGKTLWLIQDVLAQYINEATGLNLGDFVATVTNQVNVMSFRYPKQLNGSTGPLSLQFENLYAGPISTSTDGQQGFEAIIRTPLFPTIDRLIAGILTARRGRSLVA